MRQRFVKDNDGHNYLIPADKLGEFYRFVEWSEREGPAWNGTDFDDCRIDGVSRWTFENAKEDN